MIQIKNPCDANWQEMTPAQSGKYCGACEKVVVDFSKMNDAEIKNYFATYKEQKTCGRFLDSQLDRPLVVTSPTRFNAFLNLLNQIPVARTVVFFLTSAPMWISSCVRNTNEDITTTGDSIAVIEDPIDTSLGHDVPVPVVGFVVPHIKQDSSIKCGDEVMGEVSPQQTIKFFPPQTIMGDVKVYDPSDDPDTIAVTIPATSPDTSDVTLHMIKGKVMMTDTISQKIKRKKK
ncbi:hypothetical protein [Cytophaga aurantiaca]|uniref:hypothetical protein n=1 Tax=Cytophaga aurantiaca TaxID=29530 RepID=UPI00035E7006|nr:hypothetical protein [Cytophaga aurantiaca]